MSDNTKHLVKKGVKDAGPCLALCLAGRQLGWWLFWDRSTCFEAQARFTFALPLPAPWRPAACSI